MDAKIERQKIVERDDFTYSEKQRIAAKSGNKCVHCGKEVYFGYGATIDHYIPLNKGGTNRDINLTMMCYDCNQEKGQKIVFPPHYVNHLNEKDYDKLIGYFDSYIQSFEFVNRKNLLACDMYNIRVAPYMSSRNRFYKRRKNNLPDTCWSYHYLKRAGNKDYEKIVAYYTKYLKKYNHLDAEEAARYNIQFWMKFGCIYFVEKNDDVKVMAAITVMDSPLYDEEMGNERTSALSMFIFPYYSTDYAFTLANNMMQSIPRFIMFEQKLTQFPVVYSILGDDKLACHLLPRGYEPEDKTESWCREEYVIIHTASEDELPALSEDKDLQAFFKKFDDVHANAEEWIKKNHIEGISWMLESIQHKIPS